MDTQFPPANFVPAKSAVPGIQLYMPAPEREKHREIVEFRCPQCNGETAYNAADGGLTCAYCGFHEPPPKEVVGKGADEFEFTVETLERAAHGWGVARQALQCQNCGATTIVPPEDLSHACPFCGSNQVIQRQAPQEVLRPRFLVPLTIGVDQCRERVGAWLGSSWMTPGSLKRMARLAEFIPIYLPYWTFDANTGASWRAQVAHTSHSRHYNSRTRRWETRSKTTWKWESGQAQLHIDDLLLAGTDKLSRLLLQRTKEYDLRDLVVYDPAYLAGVKAQAYDIPLENAWSMAREEMRERTKRACQAQATSQRMRSFSMDMSSADEAWRYILLPAYVATYRYESKVYQVMVNGQTGVVAGQRPVDWPKVGLAMAGLVAPGLILGLVGLLLLLAGVGAPLVALAFVVLMGGAIGAAYLFTLAQKMDDV